MLTGLLGVCYLAIAALLLRLARKRYTLPEVRFLSRDTGKVAIACLLWLPISVLLVIFMIRLLCFPPPRTPSL
ncbi:MAG: hypothetical protein HY397_01975 [Candidatus Doudnabacteria bacterium]|nr:hypothetical protein [Candidatus Doudnabacteria bacterium]